VNLIVGEVEEGNAGGEGLFRAAGFTVQAGDAHNAFSRWVLRQHL
jgi:hypothetical protein